MLRLPVARRNGWLNLYRKRADVDNCKGLLVPNNLRLRRRVAQPQQVLQYRLCFQAGVSVFAATWTKFTSWAMSGEALRTPRKLVNIPWFAAIHFTF
jgi:hypothetical protein